MMHIDCVGGELDIRPYLSLGYSRELSAISAIFENLLGVQIHCRLHALDIALTSLRYLGLCALPRTLEYYLRFFALC